MVAGVLFFESKRMLRPARLTFFCIGALLIGGSSILFFRYFITVDGPIHVLRASLLGTPWFQAHHAAGDIAYNTQGIPTWLGNRLLSGLLIFVKPEQAHDVYASFVCISVMLGAVAFLRANHGLVRPAVLWLIPLSFNVLLLMGLLHFLLGVAIALASVAWWKWKMNSRWVRWAGLLAGAILAWQTHRSAPALLCVVLLPMLAIELRDVGGAPARLRRCRAMGMAAAVALISVCAVGLFPVLKKLSRRMPQSLPSFEDGLLLRPLYLPDEFDARWATHGISALLLIATIVGTWVRWRMGRKLLWHDAMLGLVPVFVLLAWFSRTPDGHELFVTERAQWLAALFLVVWLAAIGAVQGGWPARVINATATCALLLHVVRLVRAEEVFAGLKPTRDAAMEACATLRPGSVVLPVMTGSNWLLQHMEAYIAIEYSGVLIVPGERVGLMAPLVDGQPQGWLRISRDPAWLMRHWRQGIPTQVDQVLFIGGDIERTVNKHPWDAVLEDRFQASKDNGLARIYSAVTDSLP